MADPVDFSSIGGTQLLEALRASDRQAQAAIRRNQLSGVNLANREVGNAIGQGLGALGRRTGVIPDPARRRAEAVDAAVKKSSEAVQGQDFESPFAQRVAQGQALVSELRSAGLTEEASKAESMVDRLRVQALEFRKLQGEVAAAEAPDRPEPTMLRRLQDERLGYMRAFENLEDPTSPAGLTLSGRIEEVNERIKKEISRTGRTAEDLQAEGLSNKTINSLQEAFIADATRLDRLRRVDETFDPNFYTLGGRIEGALLRGKSFLKSDALTPEEKKELTRRSVQLQNVAADTNELIKEFSGAAVSAQEFDRMRKQLIDPGDPPDVVRAKIDETMRTLSAVQARRSAAIQANDLTIINEPLDNWITEPERGEINPETGNRIIDWNDL